jgi:tetratricopeptide (TPR) repeat protein
LPLLFVLCPLAGYAVVEATRRWRARTGRPLVVLLALAAVATVVVGQVATRATPRDLIRLASVLSIQERLDESLAVLAPDLDGESPDPLVLDQAGWVLQKKGDHTAARDRYLQALDSGLPPERARQTRTRLGMVLEHLERFDEAAAQHDAAVASDSANAGTYYERAMFRLRRGDRIGGLHDLQQAVRIDPGWPAPRQALRSLGVSGY